MKFKIGDKVYVSHVQAYGQITGMWRDAFWVKLYTPLVIHFDGKILTNDTIPVSPEKLSRVLVKKYDPEWKQIWDSN